MSAWATVVGRRGLYETSTKGTARIYWLLYHDSKLWYIGVYDKCSVVFCSLRFTRKKDQPNNHILLLTTKRFFTHKFNLPPMQLNNKKTVAWGAMRSEKHRKIMANRRVNQRENRIVTKSNQCRRIRFTLCELNQYSSIVWDSPKTTTIIVASHHSIHGKKSEIFNMKN